MTTRLNVNPLLFIFMNSKHHYSFTRMAYGKIIIKKHSNPPNKKENIHICFPPRVKYFPAFHPCHVISTLHNPQYERFIVNTAFSLIFHISWSSSSHATSRGCFRSQLIQNLLSEFINSGTIYYNF